MAETRLAVLKTGGKIVFMPACPHCGGTDFKCTQECEDGYLLVECKKCEWSYGLDSNGMTPCLQNYLLPLFDWQKKQRQEIDAKIEAAKTPEERDKYLKLRGERIHRTGIEINRAWELILERFRRGGYEYPREF